jgi:hypothetical protein
MNDTGEVDLVGDALPLEIVDIDGQSLTFIWYFLGGVDRLTITTTGDRLGVVEQLESAKPRLLPDSDWSEWLDTNGRTERIIAAAQQQWHHRGEIVADRALHEGGQL